MPLSLNGSGRDYFSSRGHILLSPILDKSDMERSRIDKEETIALTQYSNYLTKTKLGQIVFLATISASSHRTGIKPAPLSWFDIRRTYFGSPGLILHNPIDKSGAKDHPIRPFKQNVMLRKPGAECQTLPTRVNHPITDRACRGSKEPRYPRCNVPRNSTISVRPVFQNGNS